MKITKTQLTEMVRKTIRTQLNEQSEAGEGALYALADLLGSGELTGMGAKTLALALRQLSTGDRKKIGRALMAADTADREDQHKSSVASNKAGLDPKKLAKKIKKSMNARSSEGPWTWTDSEEPQGEAVHAALDEWFGEGWGNEFENAIGYYDGDSDTFRKMSDKEADKLWKDSKNTLEEIIRDLLAL